ncbi:MAG: ligase-associated DNA damage response endonuclease PdeM [Saprospiraceae bacterium]
MEIEIREHQFELLPQKAILWKNKKTLLIADLHLGKITHFRKSGIAIPSIAFGNNFQRLDEMILPNDVERIIFLGDLFHHTYNDEWIHLAEWRKKYSSVEIQLVLGNHDILPPHLFSETNMQIHDHLHEDQFLFTHHPGGSPYPDTFVFSGHIHPVYCLRSKARQSIRLPCFIIDPLQAILPSFGVFTGGFEMEKIPGRGIYVIAENKIVPI